MKFIKKIFTWLVSIRCDMCGKLVYHSKINHRITFLCDDCLDIIEQGRPQPPPLPPQHKTHKLIRIVIKINDKKN